MRSSVFGSLIVRVRQFCGQFAHSIVELGVQLAAFRVTAAVCNSLSLMFGGSIVGNLVHGGAQFLLLQNRSH